MKNKKGFTFVELLAVITIIGVLTLILLPTIERMTQESKDKVYNQQLNNIILSLKSWASDNRLYLPEKENEILTITLGNLKTDGYIEYDVKNPLNNKCFDNSMALIITKNKKTYDYSIDLDTIKESNECEVDTDNPIIVLNGNTIENVEVNTIYIDKGVIAKDKNGNNITDDVITTITGSGNAVNTSNLNNQYIITYSVTSNGKTAKISRTVKVVDTKVPELVIPGDVLLDTSITSFDMMNGVSATDNSGEEIKVSSTSNIVFGSVGKYTITYKATDSSNNTTTKKRFVTISKVVNKIMASNSNCIKNIGVTCPNGTEVSVQVNDEQTYNFYVIKDTGTKLTLIMDRNLGGTVAWYADANSNHYGPLTALTALESRTNGWTNIDSYSYTLKNDVNDSAGGTNTYNDILRENVKARMLTQPEALSLGCKIGEDTSACPSWLYKNLSSSGPEGYWLSTAYSANPYHGWIVSYGAYAAVEKGVRANTYFGVRPVIEISK